jgi:hypothetical protein
MNERIRELAEQCIDQRWTVTGPMFDREKFAELIVEECGDWIINNAGAMEHLGPLYFAKAMQKDFGVEE